MLRIRSLNSQRRVPSKLFRIIWNILFSTIFTSSDYNLTTKWKQQTNGMNWRVDNGKIIRSLLIFSNEGGKHGIIFICLSYISKTRSNTTIFPIRILWRVVTRSTSKWKRNVSFSIIRPYDPSSSILAWFFHSAGELVTS